MYENPKDMRLPDSHQLKLIRRPKPRREDSGLGLKGEEENYSKTERANVW